ncbi:MAG: hypothetical protein HC933_14585 [Pleurocapsa sp. SU_196_0]|nr:hypothetical protein [Pleurocapsa sp. SU_196_0]
MPERAFKPIFERLRGILKPLEANMKLKKDRDDVYDLYTNQVRADGYEYAFGAVTIKKNYVSYHLFPMYTYPDLVQGLSDGLKKRMQGKTCFNFKTPDERLFSELETLTLESLRRFERDGYE